MRLIENEKFVSRQQANWIIKSDQMSGETGRIFRWISNYVKLMNLYSFIEHISFQAGI